MDNYSKFFDENGNLVMTQKDIDRMEEERRRKEEEEELQRKKELISLNKDIELDKRSQEIAEKYRNKKKREETLKKWSQMPEWLRRIKVTPMSSPPTEGKKEMLLYKLTKKVELTDDERARRVKQAKTLAQALDDHNKIHQELPNGTPLSPVTVVSVSHGTGGSTLTRALSAAMQMSRYDLGNSFSVDMSSSDSVFTKLFAKTPARMTLRIFLNVVKTGKYMTADPTTFIPSSDAHPREHFLDNIDDISRRVEPGISDVIESYRYLQDQEGFIFFDCDYKNIDAVMGSMLLSNSVVFVVEPIEDNVNIVKDIVERYRDFVDNDPQPMEVVNNIRLVFMASDKRFMTKDNIMALKKLLAKMAGSLSIDSDKTYLVPYDKALSVHPVQFDKCRTYTSHIIRSIAGGIVDDAVRRNS